MDTFLITLFTIVCVLLIIVVLLQKGRGGGLGAAFGGLGSSAFGTRVGDVFTWVTIVLTVAFLLLAIGTTMWFRPKAETVEKPTLSPLPGKYTDQLAVTIECPTRDCEIYYTTNGNNPTVKDTSYVAPVRIKPGKDGVILKAKAFKRTWTPSEVVGGYYGPNPPKPSTGPAITPTAPATKPATTPTGPATKPAPAGSGP
jgi:preprotein translocase subunit SecG